jgi:hypothetical protein
MKLNLYIVYNEKDDLGFKYENPVYLMGECVFWKQGKSVEGIRPYAIFNTRKEATALKKVLGKKGKVKLATLIIN